MPIKPEQFEKLGVFYTGTESENRDAPVLYDSSDLTTHGVIIGMTGSGKTGLGVGLIEEAAMDRIPVIAVDPKGDLGNLLLGFPQLRGSDFEPWIDPQAAATAGKTVSQFADDQAAMWKKGLESSGQSGERIRKLHDTADITLFTPGSASGRPLSVLQRLAAPDEVMRADYDLYSQKVETTTSSVLTLLGVNADPLTSREHILLANIIKSVWDNGEDLDLPGLIGAIQNPPIKRIGVMDVESFFPAKDRFALAMRINGLLASPGFAAWLSGEPLNAETLLHAPDGRPRVSVLHIAHLNDAERMFFVTLLLSEIIAWMRRQPGTGSLRAILYIDELFGYMPPTANPPSKLLLLTLLKQARAFGLGVVMSTQNPVDLDYKGLSNCGTWFIGRLQTERDRARVLDGLSGAGVSRSEISDTINNLGKRQFLLHNVHESGDVVLNTRWVMSYLAGPLTRQQIGKLIKKPDSSPAAATPAQKKVASKSRVTAAPTIPPGIDVKFAATLPNETEAQLVYLPQLFAEAEVAYLHKTYGVDAKQKYRLALEMDDDDADWGAAELLAAEVKIRKRGLSGAEFGECPSPLLVPKNHTAATRTLKRWLRIDRPLQLLRCKPYKLVSKPGESEALFRARIQHAANEARDLAAGKLKKRYESKFRTLSDRISRAEARVEREEEQVSQKKMDTAISFGTTVLGALFGRKTMSKGNVSKAGTALRKARGISKEKADVERAEARLEELKQQLAEMEQSFQDDIAELEEQVAAKSETLEAVEVRAKSADIHVSDIAILWRPYWRDANGRLRPGVV